MAGEGRWLALHVLTAQGENQELVLKGNVYPESGIWWDLYEPVHYLIQNKSLKLGKVLSKDLHECLAECGGLDGPHFTRSRRASGMTDTSQEYTASSHEDVTVLINYEAKHCSQRSRVHL
eukprot:1131985-Amphidinium_carterae.1